MGQSVCAASTKTVVTYDLCLRLDISSTGLLDIFTRVLFRPAWHSPTVALLVMTPVVSFGIGFSFCVSLSIVRWRWVVRGRVVTRSGARCGDGFLHRLGVSFFIHSLLPGFDRYKRRTES
jgi:hypothetical protein